MYFIGSLFPLYDVCDIVLMDTWIYVVYWCVV